MGLDCTAYRSLTKAAPGEGEDGEDTLDGYHRLWLNDDFPSRAVEFEHKGIYRAAETFQWRAGSYSGFNAWRTELANLACYEPEAAWAIKGDGPASLPFFPLVHFSDCEGALGTAVCARLAKDFAELQAKADAHPDEWFRKLYASWRKACEMAADGGAISFH